MNYERIEDIRISRELKRMRHKLYLYFDYTKEYELVLKQLYEYEEALAFNDNNPRQAAHECGVKSLDVKRPAEQQLLLSIASCESVLKDITTERTYLGLDAFIDNLGNDDFKLLQMVYYDDMPYSVIGVVIGYSKGHVGKKIDSIINRFVKSER